MDQIVPPPRQPNHGRGEQDDQNLQAHHRGTLETRYVEGEPPFEAWNSPVQHEVPCGILWRQQRVAANQEQEQPFEPPRWTHDLADGDATDEQRECLKGEQGRDNIPAERTRCRKRW